MTYSVLAHCPRTGRIGLGTATFSLGTGGRAAAIRSGAGVAKTQANPQPDNDLLALRLMAQGHRPARVLEMVAAQDGYWSWRQMGLVDTEGRAAAHTGQDAKHFAGHLAQPGIVVLGNVVAGPKVLEAMVAGFHAAPSAPLAFRILAALEAGRDAGGQSRDGAWIPERSAVLRIASAQPWLELDLAVDRQSGAVEELRRVLQARMASSDVGAPMRQAKQS